MVSMSNMTFVAYSVDPDSVVSVSSSTKGDWVKNVIPYRTAVWFVPNEYCCGGTWWSSSGTLAAVVFVIKFAVIVTVVVGPGLVRGIHKQWGTRRRVVLFRWWRRRPLLVGGNCCGSGGNGGNSGRVARSSSSSSSSSSPTPGQRYDVIYSLAVSSFLSDLSIFSVLPCSVPHDQNERPAPSVATLLVEVWCI